MPDRAVVEPPRAAEQDRGIVARERRELAAVRALVEREENDARSRGSLPYASSSGRRPRVQSVATGMSAPMSRPNRSASGPLWSRRLPTWSCITSPSSQLIRANSFSMCASKRRASTCGDAARERAREERGRLAVG